VADATVLSRVVTLLPGLPGQLVTRLAVNGALTARSVMACLIDQCWQFRVLIAGR
jgi:hypothetical protein